MTLICGVDEAGRGPVIGPLVIAGVCIAKEQEQTLREWGVKDSKLLSEKQREALFDRIQTLGTHHLVVVQPNEIDEAVTNEKGDNLNWLEGRKVAEIINTLEPNEAIIDCPSTNVVAFTQFLEKKISKKIPLLVEHKADVNHVVVGAASILAKVTRDRAIKELEKKHGRIGSGYPADPFTQQFIKENFQKCPAIFRKSWATFKNLVKEKGQKKLSE